ncbi:hypothetical protein IMZ48_39555 [Candidatus Bathyarchaeota archaeon]|nr:hypothetical protein [Candidatus Bathyarchaeota archaeon]
MGFCKAGDTCCNGNGCASSGASCCGRGRQCPKGTQCCKDEDGDLYCAATCVPSLIFPYVKGLLDEVNVSPQV